MTEKDWDWFKFLDPNYDRTSTELKLSKYLASDWVTCACGQLCKRLRRDHKGAPSDDLLRSLGQQFYSEISTLQWSKARKTINYIEMRSSQLLQEQN